MAERGRWRPILVVASLATLLALADGASEADGRPVRVVTGAYRREKGVDGLAPPPPPGQDPLMAEESSPVVEKQEVPEWQRYSREITKEDREGRKARQNDKFLKNVPKVSGILRELAQQWRFSLLDQITLLRKFHSAKIRSRRR